MKRAVKIVIFLIIAAIAAAYGYYTLTAPVSVAMTAVREKPVELSFSEQGLVAAENVILVYPLAQGRLLKVNAAKGDTVKAGDVLCEIDPGPLSLQYEQTLSVADSYKAQIANLDAERNKQTADLTASRSRLTAEIAVIDAQERNSRKQLETLNVSVEDKLRLQDVLIEQCVTDLARARAELGKAAELYEAGGLTRSEYDSAADLTVTRESALKAAELEREVIEGGRGVSDADYYQRAREAVEAQIASIDESLETDYTEAMKDYYGALIEGNRVSAEQILRQINDCLVTAPAGGTVTGLNVLNTNYVSMTYPAAEITTPGDNVIEVFVSTNDVDSIKAGDTVGITLKRREGDAVFTGVVTEIGGVAELRLSALGVEERKVKVKVAPNAGGLGGASFGLGFEADVKFYVYRAENKLAVPKTALYKDNGKDMLWAARGGKAVAVEVTVGMELRTETVIESGIRDGEFVITDANNKNLKNGVSVINRNING